MQDSRDDVICGTIDEIHQYIKTLWPKLFWFILSSKPNYTNIINNACMIIMNYSHWTIEYVIADSTGPGADPDTIGSDSMH